MKCVGRDSSVVEIFLVTLKYCCKLVKFIALLYLHFLGTFQILMLNIQKSFPDQILFHEMALKQTEELAIITTRSPKT